MFTEAKTKAFNNTNRKLGTWLITLATIIPSSDRQTNVSTFFGERMHVFIRHLPVLPTHDRLQSIPGESQSIQKSRFLRLLNRMMPKNRVKSKNEYRLYRDVKREASLFCS